MILRPLLTGLVLAAGGCNATVQFRGASSEKVSAYVSELLRPVTLLGAGIGTFRVKEGRWPASIEEITASAGPDENWKNALAAFSDISLARQPDGSMIIAGKITPPADGNVTIAPVGFSATVTVRRAPEAPSGWEPRVEAKIDEAKPEAQKSR